MQEEQSPAELIQQLGDASKWAFHSLEIFREELLAALYPLVVHVFLSLVRNGYPNDGLTWRP